MVRYTLEERKDMFELYIKCSRNSLRAKQRYVELYPERNHPDIKIFRRLSQTLAECGSFNRSRDHYVTRREPVSDINVLAQIHINPENSCRKIAPECNLSKSRVQQIIRKYGYHDYKYQPVQNLNPNDPQRRLEFCNWFRRKLRNDNNFSCKIIWGDETSFTNKGIFNRRNKHFYATNNPHLIQEVRPQVRFSLNLWCGLIDNKLLGPYFIQGNLNAQKYVDILEDMIDNLPLQFRQNRVWFQQDGAGPHNAAYVRNYLNETFPASWMGTRGPVAWPARSPDLNPLDYYLWGYLKNKVYDRSCKTIEELQEKIMEAFETIEPEVIQAAIHQMDFRTSTCIEQNGAHFEQLM